MKALHIPATIDSFRSLVDRTYKITISTQELPPEHVAILAGYNQTYGHLLFQPERFETVPDLPKIAEPKGKKSASKRLRDVIYLVGQEQGTENDETFYQNEMTKIIEHYQSKLD